MAHKRKSFSLVEILVVVTIISLLAGIAASSYAQFIRQSRDAKRKTDIEQIRAAIEMYRNFNNVYPTAAASPGMNFGVGGISDASSTYLSKLPNDPRTANSYYYEYISGQDYRLCAYLEASGSPYAGTSCGGAGLQCTYCMGPYGEK